MTTMIDELAQTAARLKREMEAEPVDTRSARYEFPNDAPWVPVLRRLPFTCALWRQFREADEARRVYDAAREKRDRWRHEGVQLDRQLQEMVQDPDTVDLAAYRAAKDRLEILRQAVDDPHGILTELKQAWLRTDERWGQKWEAYVQRERNIAHQQARTVTGGYDYSDRAQALGPMLEAKRADEAPWGE